MIASSAAALAEARRNLTARWQATEVAWKDGRARQYHEAYIAPVDPALRRACDAIGEMAALLERAARECE
jgi:hypothetical protein